MNISTLYIGIDCFPNSFSVNKSSTKFWQQTFFSVRILNLCTEEGLLGIEFVH